jgi:hypothetical protein
MVRSKWPALGAALAHRYLEPGTAYQPLVGVEPRLCQGPYNQRLLGLADVHPKARRLTSWKLGEGARFDHGLVSA